MTRKISNYFNSWLGITLFFPVVYIILGCTGGLIFGSNDDAAIIYITSGMGDFHTGSVHPILGWMLRFLYYWKPNFFWYDLIIVLVYTAGIFRFTILFRRYQTFSSDILILLISCILLGFLPFQPNFTFLSFMLAIVAVFPVLAGDCEEAACHSLGNVMVCLLFLFGACLYRTKAALLTVGCALVIYLLLTVCESIKLCPKSSLWNFWRRAIILIGMACLATLLHAVKIYTYTALPDYNRYREYTKYRVAFTDLNRYRYNQAYENLNISENDFNLMIRFKGIDSPPLHLENLKRLPSVSIGENWRIRAGLNKVFRLLKQKSSMILLTILLCACLLSRPAQIVSAVCLAVIAAVAVVTSRMKLRVLLPILTLSTIMSIHYVGVNFKKPYSRTGRIAFTIFYCLILSLALILTCQFQYSKINTRIKILETAAPIWEYCDKENIEAAALWVHAIPGGNKRLFVSDKLQHKTRFYRIGGWTGSLPNRLNELRTFYGQDIYAGLAKIGTYHIFSRLQKDLFETFVKEHGQENAEPRVLYETKDTVLYRIGEGNKKDN